jgi:hypothetical protein
MDIQDQAVEKKDIFAAMVTSAADYYKTIITVATLFLGGTLLFLEKLAPASENIVGKWLLGFGWALLILSIVAIAAVQLINIESGRRVMIGEAPRALKIDRLTGALSWVALISITLGISCVMIFGYRNLNRSKGGITTVGNKVDVTKTIPFGNTQSGGKPPAGNQGTPPASTGGGKK